MKRFLSVFLAITMMMALVCITSSAEGCKVTLLGEAFDEKNNINPTGTFDYWSVGDSLTSKIINTKNEKIFDMIALGAKTLRNNVFLLTRPQQLGTTNAHLVDFSGKQIMDYKCEILGNVNDNILIFSVDGKIGLYDFVQNKIIAEGYTQYSLYTDSVKNVLFILLKKAEMKWDLFNVISGNVKALPDNYSYSFCSEKYLSFLGEKNGFMDIEGNVIFSNEGGRTAYFISGDIFKIYDGNSLKICDASGNIITDVVMDEYNLSPISVDETGNFVLYSYQSKGEYKRVSGLMSKDGEILTEEKYFSINSIPGQKVFVLADALGNSLGVMDYLGNFIIPEGKYASIYFLGGDLWLCDAKEGIENDLIRFNGTEVEYVMKVYRASKLYDKYIIVSIDNKYGVIDYYGNTVVPFEYEDISLLNDFLFLVKKDGKSGVCDYYGNEILECRYSSVKASGANRTDAEVLCVKDAESNKYTFVRVDNSEPTDISVKVNGVKLGFDQAPVIKDGRTLVPLRAIFEALGASVSWNGETRTVTAIKGDVTVSLTIDSDVMTVNGKEEKLDVPATIIGGRTLVPARAVSQALSYKVSWDGDTRTVGISR